MFFVDETSGSFGEEVRHHFHARTDSADRIILLDAVLGILTLAHLVNEYIMDGITFIRMAEIPDGTVMFNMPRELNVLSLVHIWHSVKLALPSGLRTLVIGAEYRLPL